MIRTGLDGHAWAEAPAGKAGGQGEPERRQGPRIRRGDSPRDEELARECEAAIVRAA